MCISCQKNMTIRTGVMIFGVSIEEITKERVPYLQQLHSSSMYNSYYKYTENEKKSNNN